VSKRRLVDSNSRDSMGRGGTQQPAVAVAAAAAAVLVGEDATRSL
jgi:hypothetical protein